MLQLGRAGAGGYEPGVAPIIADGAVAAVRVKTATEISHEAAEAAAADAQTSGSGAARGERADALPVISFGGKLSIDVSVLVPHPAARTNPRWVGRSTTTLSIAGVADGMLAPPGAASHPVPARRPAASLPASSPRSVALPQLRFASFAMACSREVFHLLGRIHAGRTGLGDGVPHLKERKPYVGFGGSASETESRRLPVR